MASENISTENQGAATPKVEKNHGLEIVISDQAPESKSKEPENANSNNIQEATSNEIQIAKSDKMQDVKPNEESDESPLQRLEKRYAALEQQNALIMQTLLERSTVHTQPQPQISGHQTIQSQSQPNFQYQLRLFPDSVEFIPFSNQFSSDALHALPPSSGPQPRHSSALAPHENGVEDKDDNRDDHAHNEGNAANDEIQPSETGSCIGNVVNQTLHPSAQASNESGDENKDENGNDDVHNEGNAANDESQPSEKGPRIRTVVNRWNDKTVKWEDVEKSFEKTEETNHTSATFRRQLDADNERKVELEEIEIHSLELKKLVVETHRWWRDIDLESTLPFTIQSPFYSFVWYWDQYEKACEPVEDDTVARKLAREDLKELMQLLRNSRYLESYFRSRDSMRSSRKTKFENLWTLFGHGTKVYARSYMDELQMFEVRSCSSRGYDKVFNVCCSAFDWDGTKFVTYSYDFYIKEFSDEKTINSLEVFPTEFYCDQDGNYDDSNLREQLYKRGRKYCDLCTNEPMNFQCEYQGTALVNPSGLHRLTTSKGRGEDSSLGNSRSSGWAYERDELSVTSHDITSKQSRIIVDNYAFLRSERNTMKRGDTPPLGKTVPYLQPECVCGICENSPLQQWRPETRPGREPNALRDAFCEDQTRLLFLPPRLLGFALKEKVWGQFLVDKLERITGSREHKTPFWEELQLEQESKELLMAYVNNHHASDLRMPGDGTAGIDPRAFDVIEGKGQGIAILLHGPPGVGKTLTAETIALATGRPLLAVSVAEIGVEAHEAERRLADVFVDATRWEAVLLLDEADIFVEERIKGDLHRNALVSVLLRCLEYYDGIIILTTNRVRSIDAAVQSRIQLAIQYHDLTTKERLAIYKNRLKWVPDEEIEDRRALERALESSPLTKRSNKANGRQIRNIVNGARALAKSKKEKLNVDHLVAVDENTSSFIGSMADWVQKQRARNEVEYNP